jgi:hypothetical protein
MAINIITQGPLAATGVRPGQWFLTSSEPYNTLITPGYLNSLSNTGIEVKDGDFVFANYDDGAVTGLFTVTSNNGIFSMNIYSPNSNSFIFQRTLFVAKGGSDLNPGTSMGLPKLTIQSAIDALMPTPSIRSVVVVLDDGTYDENLTLTNNIQLWMPYATMEVQNGDVFTIQDTGVQTLAVVNVLYAQANNGKLLNIQGQLSSIFLDCQIGIGDMNIEGACVYNGVALLGSNVVISATGSWAANVLQQNGGSITNNGSLVGNVGTVTGTKVNYGANSFNDKLTFQSAPATEIAGRTLALGDGSATIVYNNVASGNYTLPATAAVSFPIGTFVDFIQLGLGDINFIAGAGVTIVSSVGALPKSNGAGTACKAYKYTDTIWVVSGDITS